MEAMETMIALAKGDEQTITDIKEKQLIGFEIDSVLFSLACSNMFLHGDGRTNLLYRSTSFMLNAYKTIVVKIIKKNVVSFYVRGFRKTKNRRIHSSLLLGKQLVRHFNDILQFCHRQNLFSQSPLIMRQSRCRHDDNKLAAGFKIIQGLNCKFNRVVILIGGIDNNPCRLHTTNIFKQFFVAIVYYAALRFIKQAIDKNGTWPDIEDTIFDAISNSKEIPGVCQKKKIYKDGVLNCAGVQTRRNSNYEMVKVSTLFHVTKGTLASESNIDGDYPFVTASEEWKTHTEYALDTEAIVYAVSAAGSLGRSHYVNGKFIASNLCLVLTSKRDPKYPIDLEFYNCYFASIKKQIVSDLADGTSKLTISPDMFKDYYIDYIPYEEQQAFVKTKLKDFLKLQEKYRQAQEKLSQDIANLSD